MLFSIKLPTKPYIAKIFRADFGEPYKLTKADYMARVILSLMNTEKHSKDKLSGTDYIHIEIPVKYVNQFRLKSISEENLSALSDYIDNSFRTRLFSFIDSRFILKNKNKQKKELELVVKIKDAIIDFCEPYGILENEISFETLQKDYYRKRIDKKNIHFQGIKRNATDLS
jgi:hypothetical protein